MPSPQLHIYSSSPLVEKHVTYYWITIVMMFLIHVGFVPTGRVSRRKSHLATLLKNTMVIPTVGVSFYLLAGGSIPPW